MLTTKHPTPTTVLYTLSTRSPPTTLTSRILYLSGLLLRLAAALLVLTTLLYEYQHSTLSRNHRIRILNNLSAAILNTQPGALLLPILHASTRTYRLIFSAATTSLILRRFHTTESLLVIRGLGVQTSTSSASYVGTARTRFIPTSTIQDIFIHEAFKGFEVRFYLSIVVAGEEGVVVVFPVSLWIYLLGIAGGTS